MQNIRERESRCKGLKLLSISFLLILYSSSNWRLPCECCTAWAPVRSFSAFLSFSLRVPGIVIAYAYRLARYRQNADSIAALTCKYKRSRSTLLLLPPLSFLFHPRPSSCYTSHLICIVHIRIKVWESVQIRNRVHTYQPPPQPLLLDAKPHRYKPPMPSPWSPPFDPHWRNRIESTEPSQKRFDV